MLFAGREGAVKTDGGIAEQARRSWLQ